MSHPDTAVVAQVEALERARTELRRGTWFASAGATMAIAGSTMLYHGVTSRCEEAGGRPRLTMALGSVTLAGGLAFAGASVPWLRRQRGSSLAHRAARIFGSMALGAVVGALLSGPATGLGAMDLITCE